MVNVTPATAPTFPITYTWGGQVYIIDSLANMGCADVVYSTTAQNVNGTWVYNKYTVLPADQAMSVIAAYQAQFGVPNIACNSLIQQASLLSGQTPMGAKFTLFGFNLLDPVGIILFLVFIIIVAILVKKAIETLRL